MATFSTRWNSSEVPSRAELAAEEADVCPFCEGDVCTGDGPACEQASQDHWIDLEIMYMRGK